MTRPHRTLAGRPSCPVPGTTLANEGAMDDLAVAAQDRPRTGFCVGCCHFRPAGSTILSAEPACSAPSQAAGSEFRSYFESRRLLLRAWNNSACDLRLESRSPD